MGAANFSYSSRMGVMLWVTVALTPVEVGVVHLLLPWPAVRWALVGLSVVTLLATVGFALSLGQRPHTLDGDELRLRFSFLGETSVRLELRPGTTATAPATGPA